MLRALPQRSSVSAMPMNLRRKMLSSQSVLKRETQGGSGKKPTTLMSGMENPATAATKPLANKWRLGNREVLLGMGLALPVVGVLYMREKSDWTPSVVMGQKILSYIQQLIGGNSPHTAAPVQTKKAPSQNSVVREDALNSSKSSTIEEKEEHVEKFTKQEVQSLRQQVNKIAATSKPVTSRRDQQGTKIVEGNDLVQTSVIRQEEKDEGALAAAMANKSPGNNASNTEQKSEDILRASDQSQSRPQKEKSTSETQPVALSEVPESDPAPDEGEDGDFIQQGAITELLSEMNDLQSEGDRTGMESVEQIKEELRVESDSLQRELEQNILSGINDMDADALRIRVVQLASEMKNRTKWESLRLLESLQKLEKDAAAKSAELLRRQRAIHEEILGRELRLKEESVSREARINLEKEHARNLQSMKEMSHQLVTSFEERLQTELRSQKNELQNEYHVKLENEVKQLADAQKQGCLARISELEKLKLQLKALESVFQTTSSYEAFSHRVHKVSVATLALANKMEMSESLERELHALRLASRGDCLIETVLAALPQSVAKAGVPTYLQLEERFKKVRDVGETVALVPDGSGMVGHMFASAMWWLKLRPRGPIEGNDVDAIFSRMDAFLKQGNLRQAVSDAEKLEGYTAETARDWIESAKLRILVDQSIGVVKAHVALLAASCS